MLLVFSILESRYIVYHCPGLALGILESRYIVYHCPGLALALRVNVITISLLKLYDIAIVNISRYIILHVLRRTLLDIIYNIKE